MSVFGADDAPQQVCSMNIDFANAQDTLRVLKAGGTMSRALQMSGNLVCGLPMSYPPLYTRDEAVSWAQEAGIVKDATTNLMDSTDPQNAATKN